MHWKFWKKPPRKARADELFPGATKPTTILASMIASDLISRGVSFYETLKSGPKVLCIKAKAGLPAYTVVGKNYKINAYGNRYEALNYIEVEVQGVTFSSDEKALILEGLKKGIDIERQKQQTKKDAESQQAAITAIEKFMGIGKLANPEPELPPCGKVTATTATTAANCVLIARRSK